MELVTGIEPATCSLRMSCSAIEPHQRILNFDFWNGGGKGISLNTTKDLLITNELLYQLSYSSRCCLQRVLYIIVCNFSRGKTEIQNAKFKMQNFGETSFPIIK